MVFQIDRQYANQIIKVPVRTFGKTRIVVRVLNRTKPNTRYFDTAPEINKSDTFVIKIPKMPPSVIMEVYNEANGNTEYDNTFSVGKITSHRIEYGMAESTSGCIGRKAFISFFASNLYRAP